MSLFVDVILPLALPRPFTYGVAKHETTLQPGMRVVVPFGKKKQYTALVWRVHQEAPTGYEVKYINEVLDHTPVVSAIQLSYWSWLAKYYLCTLGEVLRAALPKALLLESETQIVLVKKAAHFSNLSNEAHTVLEALALKPAMSIQELPHILNKKTVMPVINSLLEQGAIQVREEFFEKYKPKKEKYVRVATQYKTEKHFNLLVQTLDKAPKQKGAFFKLLQLEGEHPKVSWRILKQQSLVSEGVLKALITKNVFEIYEEAISRLQQPVKKEDIRPLTTVQNTAKQEILAQWTQQDVCLFHGVTGSGKTEVYKHLIKQVLGQGKQVLYMLPEIALTTQIIVRMQHTFGEKVAVYHSKYSSEERIEVWQRIRDNNPKAQLVVGARSAQFLPFQNLGLIIIDESHEASYKQFNPAPRYFSRDSALFLARLYKAKVLLGSATPSIESRFHAANNKFGYVFLQDRFKALPLPNFEVVDLRTAYKKKQMHGPFSTQLVEAIKACLQANKQLILFQNRRGFAPVVQCKTCGVTPQCPNCDVSVTFHQNKNELRCHYCGYSTPMWTNCSACGSYEIDTKGLGTEQIEIAAQTLFPDARIIRMDQDTTRGKYAHEKLLEKIVNREVDIIVGTQMLAKGLDFDHVNLVAIMHADSQLNFPDFRAHERAFQLFHQVAGRAGRKTQQGKVILQTFTPEHPIIKCLKTHDYSEMYTQQLIQRNTFKYPPFYRTVQLTFKSRDFTAQQQAAHWLVKELKTHGVSEVLGPETPPIARVRNEYISQVLIKLKKDATAAPAKQLLWRSVQRMQSAKAFAKVRVLLDVDNQ